MIFAVFAVDKPSAIGPAIAAHYPSAHIKVAEGQWLIIR
jgi:hypothetical protein